MSSPKKEPALFPFALVAGNVEGLQARHGNRSSWIYLVVVLALLAAAAATPFIEVAVGSRSRGILRPSLSHTPVTAAVSGKVLMSRLQDNATVGIGDTLLVISNAELVPDLAVLERQITEQHRLLADLEILNRALDDYPLLQSAVYQRDYQDYHQRREEAKLKIAHATRQFERQQKLFATRTIARMEFEQAEYELQLAQKQLALIEDRQSHLWSQERQRVARELLEVHSRQKRLEQQATNYLLTAPVAGSLTETGGLSPGSFVAAGQSLAVISPDGDLHVEAFVNPSDIGLLREGMSVQVQLDAFNHHQWGLARATVADIAQDVSERDGQTVFRVKCTLHDRELYLKNGYRGRLRKGMTLTTHFTLTRRSLFQLLHDKLDDWFNPHQQ
ncbi:MAG: HlyD family efflux transporter periplasmic adaptor subunit [Bacteroidota bacterium]